MRSNFSLSNLKSLLFFTNEFYFMIFLFLILNTLILVFQGGNTLKLITLFISIIVIVLMNWLQEKYKKNIFNLLQEIFLFLINCLLVIMELNFIGKENTNSNFFEIMIIIYGEFLLLCILKIKILRVFSLIFYFILIIICLSPHPVQIAYILLIRIGIFFKIPIGKIKTSRFSDNSILKYHYEKTFIINDKHQFILMQGEKKDGKENFLTRLQKLDIFLLGEFSSIPSEIELKKCLIDYKINDSSMNLVNFIKRNTGPKVKNTSVFFLAQGRFFSETENDIIFFQKIKENRLLMKIRREILYDELIKMRQTNTNYSKAIAFVAHEFRTPLNCIVSMLQTLDQQLDTKLSNNYIVPAIVSSKFLLNLVSDLLDIAQIEAEKFRLVPIDFDLKFLMQDTLQIVVFQASKRNIDLKMNFDNNLKNFRSDPNRIRQIIINLLGNAIKYTTKGSITLSAKRLSIHQAQISVEDTGLGIDANNLDKLFKAFGKVSNPADSALNAQGVGLGLLISNKLALILNDMEEGIKVESEIGKGSKFSFKIIDFSPQEQIPLSSHRVGYINLKECKFLGTCGINKKKGDTWLNIQKSSDNMSDLPSLNETDTFIIPGVNEKASISKSESLKKGDTNLFNSLTSSFFFLSDFHSFHKPPKVSKFGRLTSISIPAKEDYNETNDFQKDNINEEDFDSAPNSFHGMNSSKDYAKTLKEENDEIRGPNKNKIKSEVVNFERNPSQKYSKYANESSNSYNEPPLTNNNKSKFFHSKNHQRNNSSNYNESTSKILVVPSSTHINMDTPGESHSKQKFSTITTSHFDSSNKKSLVDSQIENIRMLMRNKQCNCPSVLVVDDNDFNILALTSHLERLGIICSSAISGDEAIEKIREIYGDGKEKKGRMMHKKLEEGERRRTEFPQNNNKEKKKKEHRSKTDVRTNEAQNNRVIKIVIDEKKKILSESIDTKQKSGDFFKNPSNNEIDNCCDYFKVIFLDLEMPGKNGIETYDIIEQFYKKKMIFEKLNVVAVTAYDRSDESVQKMLEKGAKDVILKPVSLEIVAYCMELDWFEE